ncbi:hypothetical protein D3C81_1477150 [compost metagenome]
MRIGDHVAALHQTNVALQLQRSFVIRVEFEDLFDLAISAVDVATTQVATRQFQFFVHAAQVIHLLQGILSPAVVRLDGQRAVVGHPRRSEVAARAVSVAGRQQRRDRLGPTAVEQQVQLGVPWVFAQAFFDSGQPRLVLTLFNQVGGFLVGHLCRTARGQPGTQAQAHQQTGTFHCVLPTDRVCDKCKGR